MDTLLQIMQRRLNLTGAHCLKYHNTHVTNIFLEGIEYEFNRFQNLTFHLRSRPSKMYQCMPGSSLEEENRKTMGKRKSEKMPASKF
jgi:hypothetical protein